MRRLTPWAQADADSSLLVAIFLYEKDAEAGWREAQAGGCSDSLWLELAEAREKHHPEDAAPIYLRQAEAAIVNSRYDGSVELLTMAARTMQALHRSEEFHRTLDGLRLKYKIKRNFIKLTEQRRRMLYL